MTLFAVPAVSLLVATLAFAFNFKQTAINNMLTRTKIISDSLNSFTDDDVMHKAFYRIEYERFEYTDNFHHTDEEREIDKLLRHFSNIAIMWEVGVLKLGDIHPIQYFILRTLNNSEIIKYLNVVDNWAKEHGEGSHPYASLGKLSDALNKKVNT